MKNLPEQIKKARLHRGLTQVQLAAILGVAQARIAEWERGTHTPNAQTIRQLENALNGAFVVLFVAS